MEFLLYRHQHLLPYKGWFKDDTRTTSDTSTTSDTISTSIETTEPSIAVTEDVKDTTTEPISQPTITSTLWIFLFTLAQNIATILQNTYITIHNIPLKKLGSRNIWINLSP